MKYSEFRIGTNTYCNRKGRLTNAAGDEVVLRHQTREVLKLLAEAHGETIGRETFFDKVWERAHVSEDSLGQCIAEIRQALGDTDRTLIETVPRKGYRLNATPIEAAKSRRWIIASAASVLLAVCVLGYLVMFPSEQTRHVVAVLPFHDVSPTEHHGLLSEPVSDGILAYLARYPELTVIARGSSFRFREPTRDLREIGALLEADYLVEGSLQFDGERVMVTSALVDVEANAQVWSDRIEMDLDDLLGAIAEIGQRIAFQVENVVSDIQVANAGLYDADAFLLSLRARKTALGGLSKDTNKTAIALNNEAVRRYPDDPWGHMGLATALRVQLRFGWAEDADETLAKAVQHAESAVRLAPENYGAHFAIGRVRMQEGNQLRAIEAFEKALQLNPSSADTMNALAQSYFYLGQTDRALEVLAQSARIDPIPGFVHSWMTAWVLWQDGQCDAAFAAFARLSAPPPEAHKLLSAIHICLGESDAARAAMKRFLDTSPRWTLTKEAAIHQSVWKYDAGRERWLNSLKRAGMPDT